VLAHFWHLAQTQGMRSATMLEIARDWTAAEPAAAPAPAGRELAAPIALAASSQGRAARGLASHGLRAAPEKARV
jgi:hypothetical protein